MKYWDLIKSLNRKEIDPLYHFTGEEDFLKSEAISKLIKLLIPNNLKDFNLNIIYGSQVDIKEIINFCLTFPINNPKRLVVLYELDRLSPSNKEKLLDFLLNLPQTTCLILVSGKVKLNTKFYRNLEKMTTTVQFGLLYDNQIPDWILGRVKSCNRKIDYKALELLQNSVGNSLPNLANEIEKLCSFLGQRERIKKDDVEVVVGATKTTSVFELANLVGQKDTSNSFFVLEKLLSTGEAPTMIIYWLTQHFIRLIKTKSFNPKQSPVPLSTFLGVRPFFVRDYKSQAQNFSSEQLEEAILLLHQADLEIKSNRIPKKLALELLIYNLCNIKEGISAN